MYTATSKHSTPCCTTSNVGSCATSTSQEISCSAAPIPWAIANLLFYVFVIPRAAVKQIGFPLAESVRESIPRPVIVTVLVVGPLLALRPVFGELTLVSLLALAAAFAVLAVPSGWWIGLNAEERTRLGQMARRVVGA